VRTGAAWRRRRIIDCWVRIAAAARLAEGFEGEEASWLGEVAAGSVRLFA